jgi:hypothetical protein
MKFNVSGTAGYSVVSAKLKLYDTDASDMGGNLMLVPDNTWTESTLKYSNAPAVSGPIVSSIGTVAKNRWYEFNMTPLVAGDGVISIRINTTSTNGVAYYSKEGTAGFRPYLEVSLAQ